MMLRASSEKAGNKVDIKLINGETNDDGSVQHGKALSGFAEAFVSRDKGELEQARNALINEIGAEKMVDAAGVAANFQRMVRIADGTGIPVDAPMNIMAQDIQNELGLKRFSSAQNTPELSLGLRLLSPILKRLAPIMMRRMAKRNATSSTALEKNK